MATRWVEHNSPTHDSEPGKHFNKNIPHSLANASKQKRTKKNLEVIESLKIESIR